MSETDQKIADLAAEQASIIDALEFVAKSMHHADTALLQMAIAMANGDPAGAVEHGNTLALIHKDAQAAIKRLKVQNG